MDKANIAIIRHSFASTVFTHKVQEVAAERQEANSRKVKVANILILAMVLILLIFQIYNPNQVIFSYLGSALTVFEILFLVVQMTFDYEEKFIIHKNSALKYLALRDKYRLLLADIINNTLTNELIRVKRDQLQGEYELICELSPQTGPLDYKEAQKN